MSRSRDINAACAAQGASSKSRRDALAACWAHTCLMDDEWSGELVVCEWCGEPIRSGDGVRASLPITVPTTTDEQPPKSFH
jgi:hypothetical protein